MAESGDGQAAAGAAVGEGGVGEVVPAAGVVRHRAHRPPGQARGRALLVRYSEEEYQAVCVAAGRAGLTATGYVASVGLSAAGGGEATGAVSGAAREALVELMAARVQLRKFGTNVNQAVAVLHASGQPPGWLEQAVRLTSRAVGRVDEAAQLLARRAR